MYNTIPYKSKVMHIEDGILKVYFIRNNRAETVTNITIHKNTERIESYKILEVTDEEGETHLLINIKCTGIVTDPRPPIRNTAHSMRRV